MASCEQPRSTARSLLVFHSPAIPHPPVHPKILPTEQVLATKIQVLKNTKMVDYREDVHKQLGQEIPAGIAPFLLPLYALYSQLTPPKTSKSLEKS